MRNKLTHPRVHDLLHFSVEMHYHFNENSPEKSLGPKKRQANPEQFRITEKLCFDGPPDRLPLVGHIELSERVLVEISE